MCEATAYILKQGIEEIFVKDVDILESSGDELRITSLYGEHKVLRGKIKSISLIDHKIILEAF
jgi:predicted RNA-binding protein